MNAFNTLSSFFKLQDSDEPQAGGMVQPLCITGAQPADLAAVSSLLTQAGMQAPQPAARAEPMDLGFWHEQVLSAALQTQQTRNGRQLRPVASPGKMWEQFAADLFVANLATPVWGWADTRSTWLLDFWQAFEPRLQFVLVVSPMQRMLASALAGADAPPDVATFAAQWQSSHEVLLRFALRHPRRVLLVDAANALAHPAALVEHCVSRWNLPLQAPAELQAKVPAGEPLATYLATHLLHGQSQASRLQQQLATVITRLGPEAQGAPPSALQALQAYRQLRESSIALQESRLALQQSQQLIAQSQADQKSKLSQIQKDLDAQKAAVQDAQKKLGEVGKDREHVQQQLSQTQKNLDAQKAAVQDAQKRLAEVDKEKESIAQELLEQKKHVTQLTSERDGLAKLATEREKQIDVLGRTQSQLKKTTQENELLLLQLHQVQEELEHYFLKHQDIERHIKTVETRWKRMLARYPDYGDYETVELVDAPQGANQLTRWRFKDLTIAERNLPVLEFQTFVENGVAGLTFHREGQTSVPFLYWPDTDADSKALTLAPFGAKDEQPARLQILLNLSTSDWGFLRKLVKLLQTVLERPTAFKLPESLKTQTFRLALEKLGYVLDKFPVVLRWDAVQLKREQVNKDYEHLWFQLQNLSWGGSVYPQFEFRLSCANVKPGSFGLSPKLEFPEGAGQVPFEKWFPESFDDFGSKLELRMALPSSMDMEVWKRLSPNDQTFLAALIKRLPAILPTLQGAGVHAKRSWDDWYTVAREMRRVLIVATEPSHKVGPAEPWEFSPLPVQVTRTAMTASAAAAQASTRSAIVEKAAAKNPVVRNVAAKPGRKAKIQNVR